MSNGQPTSPLTPVDSGSQALAEALRSSFVVVKIVMAALVIVFLGSGFFTVGSHEKAIILRFGRPVGEGDQALLGAGAHWAFPYPIDEVIKVPITEIQQIKSTVGWFAQSPEQEALNQDPPAGETLNPAVDGYVLTADGNIVHTKATLNYRIEDPIRYVFDFVNASNAVQNALNNALVHTAARFNVDDMLTRDKAGFKDAVQRRVGKLIQEQRLGVVVDQCVVQSRPPRQLKLAFDNVVTAGQYRRKVSSDAEKEANQITNKASAAAFALINSAEVERTNRVATLAAEADNFRRLLPKYQANPDLFIQQRLVETMGRVLTNLENKMFLPTTADGKPVEVRLLIDRESPKRNSPVQPQP